MLIEFDQVKEKQYIKLQKRLKILDDIYFDNKNFVIEFLTITYKDNNEFEIFRKNKLHSFLMNLKKNYGLESYFWVVEPQKRGVLHYHFLLIRDKKSKKIGFIDKHRIYKKYVGYTNIKTVKTRIYYYLLKYLQKDLIKSSNSNIYKEVKKGPIRKQVKIRYRRYGFGGKIKKNKKYKEIMLKYIEKELKKYEIEIDRKNKEIIYNNVKIRYGFVIERIRYFNSVEIKEGYYIRYEKVYKNLFEYEWRELYKIDFSIFDFEDYKIFIKLILLELGLEELN